MAFKPVAGMLQRALVKDICISLGLGIAASYVFWYGFHLPSARKRKAYYEKMDRSTS